MGSTETSRVQIRGTMALLILTLLCLAISAINTSEDLHIPRHDLSTDTMITLAGYESETHKVVTPDGYILTLYRIVGSGPVVFMQHGLEDSSAAWVLAGPDHGAPAFRLAAEGYDVWLGNYRGNHDSREHQSLDADRDNEFGSSHGTRWQSTICQQNSTLLWNTPTVRRSTMLATRWVQPPTWQ